jgi:hypothetical protein
MNLLLGETVYELLYRENVTRHYSSVISVTPATMPCSQMAVFISSVLFQQ